MVNLNIRNISRWSRTMALLVVVIATVLVYYLKFRPKRVETSAQKKSCYYLVIGNGFCDDEQNSQECIFDGGDCCLPGALSKSNCDICACHGYKSSIFAEQKTSPDSDSISLNTFTTTTTTTMMTPSEETPEPSYYLLLMSFKASKVHFQAISVEVDENVLSFEKPHFHPVIKGTSTMMLQKENEPSFLLTCGGNAIDNVGIKTCTDITHDVEAPDLSHPRDSPAMVQVNQSHFRLAGGWDYNWSTNVAFSPTFTNTTDWITYDSIGAGGNFQSYPTKDNFLVEM